MSRSGSRKDHISIVVSDVTRLGAELLAYALRHQTHGLCQVIAAETSANETLRVVEAKPPEMVIVSMDLQEGPGTGIAALRQIHARFPEVACVAIMDDHSGPVVLDVFRAGARGLVFRSEMPSRLVECVRNVHAGQVWASTAEIEEVVHALATTFPVRAVSATGQNLLTPRQKEIVALVAEGMTNKEISERVRLSEHTVKNYLFRVFDKLGVSSRAELIVYALHQQNLTD